MKKILFVCLCMLLSACRSPLGLHRAESSQQNKEQLNSRKLDFSGFQWSVRDSKAKRVGPGGNVFSSSNDNVWVDESGRLHLKITKDARGRSSCAEVTLVGGPLGYGRYTFYISSDISKLDEHIVLGMFTYLHDAQEIDIELSRWGDPEAENAQFAVQPAEKPGNTKRFNIPGEASQSVHSFLWQPDSIAFQSYTQSLGQAEVLSAWSYQGEDIPKADAEELKINLWLYRAKEPKADQELQVVIDSVSFSKYP